MEIKKTEPFLSYYQRTRETTKRVIAAVPADRMDWSYLPGKFTIADLIRHLAAIERNVFAEMVQGNPPKYRGCGKELADGQEAVLQYFNTTHDESMAIFSSLKDEDLVRKIKSLDGKEVEIGNFLRALVLHEIHHRGALCIYLNLLGINSPSILGFNEQQVIQASN